MPNSPSMLHRLRGPFAAVMLFGAAGIIAMVVALTASGGSPAKPRASLSSPRSVLITPSPSPSPSPVDTPAPTDIPVDTAPPVPTIDPNALLVPVVPAPRHHGKHESD